MLEGMYVENIMMHSETRVYPQEPQITAGLILGTDAIYRYSLRESTYPTLTIVDEITDSEGNKLPSGHYELALSDDMDYLLITQSKKVMAIIPVYDVEIDMSHYKVVRDKKALKRQKKEEKEIAKTNKKRARQNLPPIKKEDEIYQEATIEYNHGGGYYQVKYERGDVRAWGAFRG